MTKLEETIIGIFKLGLILEPVVEEILKGLATRCADCGGKLGRGGGGGKGAIYFLKKTKGAMEDEDNIGFCE